MLKLVRQSLHAFFLLSLMSGCGVFGRYRPVRFAREPLPDKSLDGKARVVFYGVDARGVADNMDAIVLVELETGRLFGEVYANTYLSVDVEPGPMNVAAFLWQGGWTVDSVLCADFESDATYQVAARTGLVGINAEEVHFTSLGTSSAEARRLEVTQPGLSEMQSWVDDHIDDIRKEARGSLASCVPI